MMTHDFEQRARGVAFLCDHHGVIRQIIRDELALGPRAAVGNAFASVVDTASREKAQEFLAALRTQGATFDWDLHLGHDGAPLTLHFAGAATPDHLLIFGTCSRLSVTRFYEEMTRINNEQLNALRALLADRNAEVFALQQQLQAAQDQLRANA